MKRLSINQRKHNMFSALNSPPPLKQTFPDSRMQKIVDDMKETYFVAFTDPGDDIGAIFDFIDPKRVNVIPQKTDVFENPQILHKDRGFTFSVSVKRSKVGFQDDIETVATGMVRPVYIQTHVGGFIANEGITSGCSIEVEEDGEKVFEYLTPKDVDFGVKLLISYMNSNYQHDFKVVDFCFFGIVNGKYGPFKQIPQTDRFGTSLGQYVHSMKKIPVVCDGPRISESEGFQIEFEQGIVWRNKEKLRIIEDGDGVFEVHSSGLPNNKFVRLELDSSVSFISLVESFRSLFAGYSGECHRGIHTEMRVYQYGKLIYRDCPAAIPGFESIGTQGDFLWRVLYNGYLEGTCFTFTTENEEEEPVKIDKPAPEGSETNPIVISDTEEDESKEKVGNDV